MKEQNISLLNGQTITDLITFKDNHDKVYHIFFRTADKLYSMTHEQSCCEEVVLADVAGGNIEELKGQKVLTAYETSSESESNADESYTWTFYNINTMTHSLTLRWLGESNGYYSEDVSFYETTDKELNQMLKAVELHKQAKTNPKPYNH